MDLLRDGLSQAWRLLTTGDADTYHAFQVSLVTSLVAVTIAAAVGLPLGAWLGLFRPRGHRLVAFLARVALAVPTVVIGLLLWSLLTRRGLLGRMDLLYSVTAITLGQTLLALPVVVSLTHAATRGLDVRVLESARTLGAGRWRSLRLALGELRPVVASLLLTAFARCVTELGIALIVGGGIRFATRTLPAQVSLELGRGEFGLALAAGIPVTLLGVLAALLAPTALDEGRA